MVKYIAALAIIVLGTASMPDPVKAGCGCHGWHPFANMAARIHARRAHRCCGCAGEHPTPPPTPPGPDDDGGHHHHPHWPWQKGEGDKDKAAEQASDGPAPVGNAVPANVE